jgi:hypothetical protein
MICVDTKEGEGVEWLLNSTKYLEPVYYIASIGLFTTVIIGLYQLKLLKSDIKTKNQRAAMEKSIEYLDWFASEFFPTKQKFREKYREIAQSLVNKVEDEKKQILIDELQKEVKFEIGANDKFVMSTRELDEYSIQISCMKSSDIDDLLNQLEIFAAVMSCGVADEEMAFTPLSDAYCSTVEQYYSALCYFRNRNDKLYSNIVKLYGIWKSRINKQALVGKQKEISEKISQLPDINVKPLGL